MFWLLNIHLTNWGVMIRIENQHNQNVAKLLKYVPSRCILCGWEFKHWRTCTLSNTRCHASAVPKLHMSTQRFSETFIVLVSLPKHHPPKWVCTAPYSLCSTPITLNEYNSMSHLHIHHHYLGSCLSGTAFLMMMMHNVDDSNAVASSGRSDQQQWPILNFAMGLATAAATAVAAVAAELKSTSASCISP